MGRRSRRKQENQDRIPWTAFERMTYWESPEGRIQIADNYAVFKNSRYVVTCCKVMAPDPFGIMVWLSIKRLDRQVIHDWRDLQRIKNELCGPECEAVELYPAESRHHDTSNQMHLWVMRSGFRFPFGYKHRLMIEHPEAEPRAIWARQRPFDDNRPPDIVHPALATNRQASELISPLSLLPFDQPVSHGQDK